MDTMDFVLNLNNEQIPYAKSIRRIPDIEQVTYRDIGKIYCIKYFIDVGSGPKMIRITSKDKSFKIIYSLDFCGLDLRPGPSFILKPMPKDKFLEFIGEVLNKGTYKEPKIIKDNYSPNYVSKKFLDEADIGGSAARIYGKIISYLSILSGFFVALGTIWLAVSYIIKIRNWYTQKRVESTIEQQINESLFSGQKGGEPAFALFDKLSKYLKYITDGNAKALIIYGPPGMSKTYTIRRTFYLAGLKPATDYVIEKGSTLGLSSTYSLLFENRDRILVLDDFDTPLLNPDTVNLLKACTDTYGKRIISLPREKVFETGEAKGSAVPSKFEFKGKIIIVTNLDRSKIDTALLSRAPGVEVNFSSEEVLKSLKLLLDYMSPSVPKEIKLEVYNYILSVYQKNPAITVNFRSFQSAVDARVGCPEYWKSMVNLILR